MDIAISDFLQQNIETLIDNNIKIWRDSDIETIVCCINEALQELYANRTEGLVRLDQDDVKAICMSVSFLDISIPYVTKDVNFIGNIEYIFKVFFYCMFWGNILPGTCIFGFMVIAPAIDIITLIKKYEGFPVSAGAVEKAVRKMGEDKRNHRAAYKISLGNLYKAECL